MKLRDLLVLNILAATLNGIKDLFVPEGNRSRTPSFGRSHSRAVRFKPHIPDGKWVMKYHRSR